MRNGTFKYIFKILILRENVYRKFWKKGQKSFIEKKNLFLPRDTFFVCKLKIYFLPLSYWLKMLAKIFLDNENS